MKAFLKNVVGFLVFLVAVAICFSLPLIVAEGDFQLAVALVVEILGVAAIITWGPEFGDWFFDRS